MRDKWNRFMSGRYGADELGRFLLGAAVVLLVINTFARNSVLSLITALLLVYSYIRMLAKDYAARSRENQKYRELKNKIFFFADREKSCAQDRKENHIYRCPKCSQKIRIPRGKGKIMVTCPKCGHEFMRKS